MISIMGVHMLEDWCKGMNIDLKNYFIVTGILEALDEGSTESTLQAVTECLNKCRMHGCIFIRDNDTFTALFFINDILIYGEHNKTCSLDGS
uniref:Paraneoplastic antigen Ma-like N-terminal domain-containing protein n=1 Tax=Terrapene triunguis TaxID=2587831 RepID=A0A674IYD0_9SAUR